jgi:hypothetical protein
MRQHYRAHARLKSADRSDTATNSRCFQPETKPCPAAA